MGSYTKRLVVRGIEFKRLDLVANRTLNEASQQPTPNEQNNDNIIIIIKHLRNSPLGPGA